MTSMLSTIKQLGTIASFVMGVLRHEQNTPKYDGTLGTV